MEVACFRTVPNLSCRIFPISNSQLRRYARIPWFPASETIEIEKCLGMLVRLYLVENGTVETKESDVHGLVQLPDGADVEHLTVCFQICIIAADDLSHAGEVRVR